MRSGTVRPGRGLALAGRGLTLLVASALVVSGCRSGSESKPPPNTAPLPRQTTGDCGELRIAYDPKNGYEASAFIVGKLAAEELDCAVTYVKTTTRKAWRLVASGKADVYLDAYGSPDLSASLTGENGPVTLLGPNGVLGGVDLLTPYFMGEAGLATSRDLDDLPPEYFGDSTPSISTVPALMPLAQSFVDSQELDYNVKDYVHTHPRSGIGDLLVAPRFNDRNGIPSFFLVQGPRDFLGEGPGRHSVQVPGSSADECEPDHTSTLCSFADFEYLKIVNSDFADSANPAYNLIYNYRLVGAQTATVLEIVELSGFDVGEADVASWINTHPNVWKRWLE